MRKFLVFLCVFLISCSSFKPVEDRSLVPSQNGVYTLETWACGVPFMGTAGCLLSPDDNLANKYIKIVVPNTNNQNKMSKMQIYSPNCNVSVNQLVKSGDEIVYSLKDLIGASFLKTNCNLDIVVAPTWQNQDQYTIVTYPLLGRVLLAVTDGESSQTSISTNPPYPFKTTGGFVKIVQKSGVTLTKQITINTQGSKAGRIFFTGCNGLPTVDYREENPTITVPIQALSCSFVGAVLRLDVKGDLEFFGQIEVLPSNYIFLSSPVINKGVVYLDPVTTASSVGGQIYFGSQYNLPAGLDKGLYYLRQTTTNGRQTLSLIKNGVIQWTIQ